MSSATRLATALFLLLAARPAARAEAPPADERDLEIARLHFDRGQQYYLAGDYATALHEFEEAKRVKDLPAFEFNVARVYDRMGRAREAIAAYKRYVYRAGDRD